MKLPPPYQDSKHPYTQAITFGILTALGIAFLLGAIEVLTR